jgi:large subunit ribosomal protein L25
MVDADKPLELKERSVIGKGLNTIRSQGQVPAVIHNHGQTSVHVMAPELELTKLYHVAGKHHPLELVVGKDKYLALIKDAHFNPVKRRLQHVVFQAIRRDEKVEAEIPVRLEGDIPAEKVGLMVLHQLDTVQVDALPQNLPDELVVDAAKLAELHDKVTVADLDIPEGVTVLTEPDHPIATVVETKAMMAEEAEAAETEGEEGEAQDGGEGETGNAPEGAESEAAGQESSKE